MPGRVGSVDPASIAWDYEVTVASSLDLDVRATLQDPAGALRVDEAATAFVDHLEVESGVSWKPAALGDSKWSTSCARRCTIRYRVRLSEAAKALGDLDTAIAAGGAIFAPPSTWLARPVEIPAGRYRLHVTAQAPVRFATGVRAAGADTYEAAASSLEESAFAAFGALRLGHVSDPGIEQAIAPGLALSDDVVTHWLRTEVSAITDYFGRPPDGHAMLLVAPGTTPETSGKTLGGGGASIVVRVGTKVVTGRELADDWIVAHELIHVAFPDVGRPYAWFAEGLATYVEPIARERAGLVTREKVWREMLDGMPQGLPAPRDGGLDGATEWGRVYWGGALYFFLADVRIRERTAGARGLQDALRAIVATGGNVETIWSIDRVLEVGDRGTGTSVLRELYNELGPARGNVDVAALMRRLGVHVEGGGVRFDDAAPLASVRDAILPRSAAH